MFVSSILCHFPEFALVSIMNKKRTFFSIQIICPADHGFRCCTFIRNGKRTLCNSLAVKKITLFPAGKFAAKRRRQGICLRFFRIRHVIKILGDRLCRNTYRISFRFADSGAVILCSPFLVNQAFREKPVHILQIFFEIFFQSPIFYHAVIHINPSTVHTKCRQDIEIGIRVVHVSRIDNESEGYLIRFPISVGILCFKALQKFIKAFCGGRQLRNAQRLQPFGVIPPGRRLRQGALIEIRQRINMSVRRGNGCFYLRMLLKHLGDIGAVFYNQLIQRD